MIEPRINVERGLVTAKLERVTPAAVRALSATIVRAGIEVQRVVKVDKLGGQVLRRRTGTLSRSINVKHENVGTAGVTSIVGTNVKYARIHEYGGVIPAHEVTAKNGQALRFQPKGAAAFIFRRSVNIPAVKMPERSFLRSALKEQTPRIIADLQAAVRAEVRDDS